MTIQSQNPSALSTLVLDELNRALSSPSAAVSGAFPLKAMPTERGLDHGVFVPLTVALGMHGSLPGSIPLIQVSLPFPSAHSSSAQQSAADAASARSLSLGRALRTLRTKHKLGVFAGGMPVHNLRELRTYAQWEPANGLLRVRENAPYTVPFLNAASAAMEFGDADEGERRARELLHREDFKRAHPTDEHFLREWRFTSSSALEVSIFRSNRACCISLTPPLSFFSPSRPTITPGSSPPLS